jgi:hypothetical protein
MLFTPLGRARTLVQRDVGTPTPSNPAEVARQDCGVPKQLNDSDRADTPLVVQHVQVYS